MKLTVILILMLSFSATVFSQSKTTKDVPKNTNYTTLTEMIYGQWKLERIVDTETKQENGNPNSVSAVNENQASNGMQIIEFTDEARYKLNNATTAVDSGNFIINERNQSLVLHSDQTANSPTEYNITLDKKNTLTLVPRERTAARYQYYYVRSKEKAGK